MQILYHKSTNLTTVQKYFIERSVEVLYRGTMDSYRVRVRNPKTILQEVYSTIVGFEKGQVKHFLTIATKESNKFSLRDEAIDALKLQPNYLSFKTVTSSYLLLLLSQLNEYNYKQTKDCLRLVLDENHEYLKAISEGLKTLLQQNPIDDEELQQLLKATGTCIGIFFTELMENGFSKGFLYRYIYGVFINTLDDSSEFMTRLDEMIARINDNQSAYELTFRVDTTSKVIDGIQPLQSEVCINDTVTDLDELAGNKEFDNFIPPRKNRCFIKCSITAPDYLAALKVAKALIAENLDVLNLGFPDEYLNVYSRVLVVDTGNKAGAQFQETRNFLDGKYKVAKEHYEGFIEQLPAINANPRVTQESKDKIKSAVRYLRLGNQSTEVEHKFINYWIGLEYLFSNYESSNTINRIKDYFVACHSLNYVKRNSFDFFRSVEELRPAELAQIAAYNIDPIVSLTNPDFYRQIYDVFLNDHPLLAFRAKTLQGVLRPGEPSTKIKDYISKHQKNLMIHFTRIYRLRNEIIHDAATNTNNESIASNLRYYLTFILNGVIGYLSTSPKEQNSIEDYFTLNEIYLGNIAHNSFPLNELLKISSAMDFIV
ncbi:MAG TPA: hypothetical protein VIM16_06305 [Mucilaginibacter sp.]